MIRAVVPQPFGAKLLIDPGDWRPAHGFQVGDSICVSGVCLTLAEIKREGLVFDLVRQTLDRTKLGSLMPGQRVNLEASLTPAAPLAGHIVQGHVDGVGVVRQVLRSEQEHRVTIAPPTELMDYLPPRGSVAVDGVSLTVAEVDRETFQVALIPITLQKTTLGTLREGEPVNIETDILTRTIIHWLRRQQAAQGTQSLTMDDLRRAGFAD